MRAAIERGLSNGSAALLRRWPFLCRGPVLRGLPLRRFDAIVRPHGYDLIEDWEQLGRVTYR